MKELKGISWGTAGVFPIWESSGGVVGLCDRKCHAEGVTYLQSPFLCARPSGVSHGHEVYVDGSLLEMTLAPFLTKDHVSCKKCLLGLFPNLPVIETHRFAWKHSGLFCFLVVRWAYLTSILFQQNNDTFYLRKEKTYSKDLGLGINFTIWSWKNLREILKFYELQVPRM